MERCCMFLHDFKKITWTKAALTICLMPFVLGLLILIIILLCSVDNIGAVVTNSRVCADIGRDLLEKGGSAVDAAIGAMLCEGISLPSTTGIGGGFTAILRVSGRLHGLTATSTLPAAVSGIKKFDESFSTGAKAVGIPSELFGYWEMHKKFGLLSWKEIFKPTIELCKDGVPITEWFAGILRYNADKIAGNPSFSSIYPEDQMDKYKLDYKIKYPTLAKTLQKIADNGVAELYGGETGKAFIEDIQNEGGILTLEDLTNYEIKWSTDLPTTRFLKKYKVVSTPLPSVGVVIICFLNIIKFLKPLDDLTVFWHYIVEAMKYSFAMSLDLGDPSDEEYADVINATFRNMTDPDVARGIRDLIKKNKTVDADTVMENLENFFGKGTTNICILAPNGEVVAITSSINSQFGAFFRSNKTGIIANDLVGRFLNLESGTIGDYGANRALPHKHFVASHSPSIILDDMGRVHFVIGATGGLKGTTLIANAIVRYMFLKQTATEAIDRRQIHHLFYTDVVEYEEGFGPAVIKDLKRIGHKVISYTSSHKNHSAATCIGCRNRMPDPEYSVMVGGSKNLVKPKHELPLILFALIITLAISVIGVMLYEVLNPRRRSLF